METNALYRLRCAQGVLRLADKYGEERINAAGRRALQVGDPSYKTVKGILVAAVSKPKGPSCWSCPTCRRTCTDHKTLFAHLCDHEAAG